MKVNYAALTLGDFKSLPGTSVLPSTFKVLKQIAAYIDPKVMGAPRCNADERLSLAMRICLTVACEQKEEVMAWINDFEEFTRKKRRAG